MIYNYFMEKGKLYVVATPIGNLGDITYRAVEVLKMVDIVLCEDTRVSKKLFDHYNIENKMLSYNSHSSIKKHQDIVGMLNDGKNIAIISDAGTPGISDPGSLIIDIIRRDYFDIEILPVPGPTAVVSLLSISGFTGNEFTFLGFVPNKKGKDTFLKKIEDYKHTVLFYESCHRILKTLEDLNILYNETHQVFIGREMTKKFETYLYGDFKRVLEEIKKNKYNQKGEFVVLLKPIKK